MSDEIKKGDLFMVVKPKYCCGFSGGLGRVFEANGRHLAPLTKCTLCGNLTDASDDIGFGNGQAIERSRVIKINPPSTGDSLPTRKELETTK